jgi:hypothetical protein
MQAGYKRFQAEAMADHARVESGFHPCISTNSGLRFTYQWGGLRLRRLDAYARAYGKCPPLDKQLAFADYELRNYPAYACFWAAKNRAEAAAALRRGLGLGRC